MGGPLEFRLGERIVRNSDQSRFIPSIAFLFLMQMSL
nr:MAG TPA: hypothetical protein [Caudoviricetes sp.]